MSGAVWLTRNGRLASSLVPRPYPLMTKTSRVDKAKILGLASTFSTNVALETCITKHNIVAQKMMEYSSKDGILGPKLVLFENPSHVTFCLPK